MKRYLTDEFLGEDVPSTLAEEAEKKVSLLYDFCVLQHKYARDKDGKIRKDKNGKRVKLPDEREETVRKMLESYQSEVRMDNAIRGVLTGDYTLNDLLTKYIH